MRPVSCRIDLKVEEREKLNTTDADLGEDHQVCRRPESLERKRDIIGSRIRR